MTIDEEIKTLSSNIAAHDHLYYSLQEPSISDAEYDDMVVRLRELVEQTGTTGTVLDQPGKGLLADHLRKVRHVRPMISLRTEVETHNGPIVKFNERVEKAVGKTLYIAEPKYDGLAVSLRYLDGQFQLAATRGDGETGEDITASVIHIPNIDADISRFPHGDRVDEIRGEVMMRKHMLKPHNEQRVREGKKEYVNCRNAAAGMVRSLSGNTKDIESCLIFMPYAVYGDDLPMETQSACIDWMEKLFEVTSFYVIADTQEKLFREYAALEEAREVLPYDIDGIVYKVNDLALQKKMGVSGREPRWAIAHKFRPQKAFTYLESIDIQVGPTGRLTPVARLTPVFVGGATVSNVTLSNVFQVRKKGIRPGDYVEIQRAGDVIPEILGKAPGWVRADGYVQNFHMPGECPVCGSPVQREKGQANYYCTGKSLCAAQQAGVIAYMVSREVLDIDGFGEALANSLIEKKLVKYPYEILTLTDEVLKDAGVVSANRPKLLTELTKARSTPISLAKFILALSIPSIGQRASEQLAQRYKSFRNFLTDREVPDDIPGINKLHRRFLSDFLSSREAQSNAIHLHTALNVQDYVETIGVLSGMSIVLTGSAPGISKDDVKDHIKSLGGSTASGVSKNTSLVVYGDGAGEKLKKAQELGTKLMTYEEFLTAYPRNGQEVK